MRRFTSPIRKTACLGALGVMLAAASTASAASTTTCVSGRVYDGGGKTIDARSLSRAFSVANASNVTIRNWTIIGSSHTRIFEIVGSSNITIENITIKTNAGDVVNVQRSSGVTIRNVTADTIENYLVWVDNSKGITLDRCSLTTGSRKETGVRVMYGVTNVKIVNSNIRNKLNKITALRLHDGSGFVVSDSSFDGQVWVGPMGGDQGGQLISNATARRIELARRTTDVTFNNVHINGALSPMAGLSGFTMNGGSVTAKSGTHFFGWCLSNTLWSYPDASRLRAGDVKRPAPSGKLIGVKFIAPGKTTINSGTNGPLTPIGCTLNGKSLGGGDLTGNVPSSNTGTNTPPTGTRGATIQGYLFNDGNANGIQDGPDTRATGKKVFLDTNNNGRLDSGEPNMYSNSSGMFTFTNLAAGTYRVRREFPSGYTYSTPLQNVTLASGQTISTIKIGSRTGSGTPSAVIITGSTGSTGGSNLSTSGAATISGYAFNDSDRDGVQDGKETRATGKRIFIDSNGNGRFDAGERSTLTNSSGNYTFTGLPAGTYRIRREFSEGFTSSTPSRNVTVKAGQIVSNVTLGSKTE